jgi:Protein of unknown function (DUF1358)
MSAESMETSPTTEVIGDSQNVTKANSSTSDSFYKLKAGLFLTSVAGIGFFAGFGSSLAAVKKKGTSEVQQPF